MYIVLRQVALACWTVTSAIHHELASLLRTMSPSACRMIVHMSRRSHDVCAVGEEQLLICRGMSRFAVIMYHMART